MKILFRCWCCLFAVSLSAQLPLNGRLELEAGTNLSLHSRPLEKFDTDNAGYSGGFGYHAGINFNLARAPFASVGGLSVLVGLAYASTKGKFTDLNVSLPGQALQVNGDVAEEVVVTETGTLDFLEQTLRYQLLLRVELSERFALLLGGYRADTRGGRTEYRSLRTTTHLYDQNRQLFIPLAEPIVENDRLIRLRRSNYGGLLGGLEVSSFQNHLYGRLLVDYSGPDKNYRFRGIGLLLLAGYRW